jgi:hypothetical protein
MQHSALATRQLKNEVITMLKLFMATSFAVALAATPGNAQEKPPCRTDQCTDIELIQWKLELMKQHGDLCKRYMNLGLQDGAAQCWRDHFLMFPAK